MSIQVHAVASIYTILDKRMSFVGEPKFQPVAMAHRLMARLTADCSAAWFSSSVNDEQTVMGSDEAGCCHSVHDFTGVRHGGRMGVIAGTDCCRRPITDRVQN